MQFQNFAMYQLKLLLLYSREFLQSHQLNLLLYLSFMLIYLPLFKVLKAKTIYTFIFFNKKVILVKFVKVFKAKMLKYL